MVRLIVAAFACGLVGLALAAEKPAAEPAPPAKMPKDTCIKPNFDCQAECFNGMKHAREQMKNEAMAKQLEVCHHACLMCYHAVGSKNVRAWEICELCEKV